MVRWVLRMFPVVAVALPAPLAMAAGGSFTLKSADFRDGGPIPAIHEAHGAGCSGRNVALTLSWSGAPAGTRSFALLMVDPDAPKAFAPHGFVHWVAYNIPAPARMIAPVTSYPYTSGTMGAGITGYFGPCPPVHDKPHHYHITLYALDIAHLAGKALTRDGLQAAMRGHIRGQATIIGTFQRP